MIPCCGANCAANLHTQSSVFDYSMHRKAHLICMKVSPSLPVASRELFARHWGPPFSGLQLVFSTSPLHVSISCKQGCLAKVDARVEAPKAKGRGSDVFVVDHTLLIPVGDWFSVECTDQRILAFAFSKAKSSLLKLRHLYLILTPRLQQDLWEAKWCESYNKFVRGSQRERQRERFSFERFSSVSS